MVSQNPIVDKLPAKGIWDNDDNALDWFSLYRLRHIGIETVQLGDLALERAIVDVATETRGTGHFACELLRV